MATFNRTATKAIWLVLILGGIALAFFASTACSGGANNLPSKTYTAIEDLSSKSGVSMSDYQMDLKKQNVSSSDAEKIAQAIDLTLNGNAAVEKQVKRSLIGLPDDANASTVANAIVKVDANPTDSTATPDETKAATTEPTVKGSQTQTTVQTPTSNSATSVQGSMPSLPTDASHGGWTVKTTSDLGSTDPAIAGWISRLKDPAPNLWKVFPNVPNPDVPDFRVVNGSQVPDGLEYGQDLSPFCEQDQRCDFEVGARQYRYISGDYQFLNTSCKGDEKTGCMLILINEGGQSYTFRDQSVDNGFTVTGRYWNGDALEWGIWGLVSNGSANMLNMPTLAHPGESLNFGTGTNAGANCGVPNACGAVRVQIVVTTGDAVKAVLTTTVTPNGSSK